MGSNLLRRAIVAACGALAMVAGFCLLAADKKAEPDSQMTGLDAHNFTLQLENHPPPNEAQIKTLLEGALAQPQPGGKILVTDAKLKRFSTNGTLELLAESPQCVFDSVERSVSSTNLLQVRTPDGQLFHEGEGFSIRTNADLIISNRVHTVIEPKPTRPHKP